MLKMNSFIYIGEKFSRKKSKGPPFGLKIPGNDLKRPDIRNYSTTSLLLNKKFF